MHVKLLHIIVSYYVKYRPTNSVFVRLLRGRLCRDSHWE